MIFKHCKSLRMDKMLSLRVPKVWMQRKFTFLFCSPRPRPFLLVQLNLQPLFLKKLGTHSIPFKPSTMIPQESRRLPSTYKSRYLIWDPKCYQNFFLDLSNKIVEKFGWPTWLLPLWHYFFCSIFPELLWEATRSPIHGLSSDV